MQKNSKIVIISLRTWPNDIGGIYDYSSKSIKQNIDYVVESTYITREKSNKFRNEKQHSNIEDDDDLIFYVMKDEETFKLINLIPKNFELTNENCTYLNNKIWYVIRNEDANEKDDNSNEDYYLSINDIIKFGKIKFAVQDIHIENNNKNIDPPMAVNDLMKYDVTKLNQNCPPVFDYVFNVDKNLKDSEIPNQEKKCFICNKDHFEQKNSETDTGESNNLISLCKCKEKGMAHLECLREIFHEIEVSKLVDKSIIIENFECPICKEQYPLRYKLNDGGRVKYLSEYYNEPKEGDYIILESLDYKKDDKYCKSIHIINLENEYITIAGENDKDNIEKDISISRFHAVLKYNKINGKICLQNKSKKFGTLVLVKNPIKVLDKTIHLQVGRTYIEAKLGIKEEMKNKDN